MLKPAFVENEWVCYHLLTLMSQLVREKEWQYRFVIPVMVELRDREVDDGAREIEQEVTLVLSSSQVKEIEGVVRLQVASCEKF